MAAASMALRGKSKSTTVTFDGRFTHACRWNLALMRTAHGLWPVKTAVHLARCGGVSVRVAEKWLTGAVKPGGASIVRLLRGEDGFFFLVAVMGDSEARWWRALRLRQELSETSRALRATERRLAVLRAAHERID
jgi:hypothetical protein